MIRISNIKIYNDIDDNSIIDIIISKYKINKSDILDWSIFKKSIDARKKDNVHYNYSVNLQLKNESKYKKFDTVNDVLLPQICTKNISSKHPIIIGAGPSGIFSALTMVQNGLAPIVIEQGDSVENRQKVVDKFRKTGKLDKLSNVQFGEGGAGTFSDGKLNSGIHSPFCKKVLEEFVNFGAPKSTLYTSKPHIGTDNLINIIKNMREFILSKGGKFYFNTKAIDFNIENNKVVSVLCSSNGKNFELPATHVVLAIGHSARDTFETLYTKNIMMERKNFSVGVRIEHLQDKINESQYGNNHKLNLPPADYKLAYHSPNGRSCYSFCMCPGGVVIASSSDSNEIVTNGMSYYSRSGKNANSAILVNVTPQDFEGNSPLAGIYFQKDLEEKAFALGGSNYFAPIQRVEDFLNNKKSEFIGTVKPTYLPGVTLSNLHEILPDFVTDTLKEGICYFDTKLHGFADPDAILTGVETRSSSPVKIYRDSNLVSNISGLYPCGEGSGYAGGIMSASVDGIKCAIAILEN